MIGYKRKNIVSMTRQIKINKENFEQHLKINDNFLKVSFLHSASIQDSDVITHLVKCMFNSTMKSSATFKTV